MRPIAAAAPQQKSSGFEKSDGHRSVTCHRVRCDAAPSGHARLMARADPPPGEHAVHIGAQCRIRVKTEMLDSHCRERKAKNGPVRGGDISEFGDHWRLDE